MKWTIDRFEGGFAVVELEDKLMVNIPRRALPPDAGEGDIIAIQIDIEETERKKSEMSKRFRALAKDEQER